MAQRNSEKVCGRKITMDKRLEVAIEQLRQGQQQGFQILYDQTHNYVFMQARTLLKNEADVHDLVQEVYINAYRSISSLQENQKIYAWLGGIAFRQATKILRKQKEIPIGEEDMPLEPMVAFDEDIQPEHALDKKESAQILRELLEELPELQKAALMAYYYNEMSIGEIAQAFSCSEGTIKSRLNYARKSLKKAIQEREKRDNIRLHSFSLPLLLLAFGNYADECVMAEQMVNGIFQHICQRLGTLSAAASPAGSGHANASPLDPSKMASGRAARYGIHKAAGKAGIAKILAITAAIGVVAVGAGSAGYHLLSGKSFAAGQEQFIPELAVAMPAFSARLQDVIKEMDGIEETAAKAREEAEERKEAAKAREEAEKSKKEKAQAKAEKKKKEEAQAKAEAEEARTEKTQQPTPNSTPAPTQDSASAPEPTPAPEQPAPEPTPAPEQSAPEPTPAPEQPASDPTPTPEPTPAPEQPAPAPTPDPAPDDEGGLDAPVLNIE